MSQENVEWARQVAEVWAGRYTDAAEELLRPHLAPDFEVYPLYLEQPYRGVEGLRRMWVDIEDTWQDYRLEIGEIVDLGEHVLVLGHVTARGPGSGVPIDEDLALLWAFRGGKAVWMRSFFSKREALEAAGLRE
jgi:hypothetical protein